MLESVIPNLVGAIIGGSLAIWGGVWKSNRDRIVAQKDAFRIFISLKRSELMMASGDDEINRIYESSKHEITRAIFMIAPFISQTKRDKIIKMWEGYLSKRARHIMDKASDNTGAKISRTMNAPDAPESRKVLIHSFLDELGKTIED